MKQENEKSSIPPNDNSDIWGLAILAVICILLTIMFASCRTVKQAVKTLDANTKESAKYCAEKWPVKTVYLPGKKQLIKGKPDTVHHHDTVTATCPDKTVIRVPCPPSRTIYQTDTLYVHDTIQVENTAVSEGLHYALVESNEACIKLTGEAKKWLTRSIWGWAAFALLVIIFALFIWALKARKL